MRKHVLFLTVAVFLSTVAFITCKKNDTKDQPENNENKEIIAKVTSWIERQKSTTLPKNHTKLDSLMNNLNFSELRFEQLNQKEQFIVIPIKKEFVTINNKDKAPINTLLLVLNDSGNIARGTIVQFIPENRSVSSTVPINTFSKIYKNGTLDCNGQFAVLTITDEFRYALNYKDGKMLSYNMLKKKLPTRGPGNKTLACWDYWWVTYYGDGAETWDYMFTLCDGQEDECQPYRLLKGRMFRLACGGGGGGDDCCIPLDDNIQFSSSDISETLSDICGIESTDPNTGLPTKTCIHSWYFSTNTILWYTWKYGSIEQAVEEKQGTVWTFKSLNHQGQITDGSTPNCVSSSCSINSATPSHSGSTARMDLQYTTSFYISCLPSWIQSGTRFVSAGASTQWGAQ